MYSLEYFRVLSQVWNSNDMKLNNIIDQCAGGIHALVSEYVFMCLCVRLYAHDSLFRDNG